MDQEELIEDFFKEVRSKYPDSVSIKGYIVKKHGLDFFTKRANVRNIIQPLLADEIIKKIPAAPEYVICTEAGAKINSYRDYINNQSAEVMRQREIAKLTRKKLKYDAANAKRIYHTYWWTFGFAIVGLVISVVLLIFKLIGK